MIVSHCLVAQSLAVELASYSSSCCKLVAAALHSKRHMLYYSALWQLRCRRAAAGKDSTFVLQASLV